MVSILPKRVDKVLQEVIIDHKLPLVHQKLTKSTHPLRVEFICKPTNTESSIFTERSEPNVLFITLNIEHHVRNLFAERTNQTLSGIIRQSLTTNQTRPIPASLVVNF